VRPKKHRYSLLRKLEWWTWDHPWSDLSLSLSLSFGPFWFCLLVSEEKNRIDLKWKKSNKIISNGHQEIHDPSTHQCTIRWMPIITWLWMNLNWVNNLVSPW
jgi:hypothetical protein